MIFSFRRASTAAARFALFLALLGFAAVQAQPSDSAESLPGPSGDPLPSAEALPGGEQASDEGGTRQALNLLWLVGQGGWLMLPIYIGSVLLVAITIERLISLRESRVMPQGLVEGLLPKDADTTTLEPRRAYRLCQRYPSAAATVIRMMLLKVGRPHSEVERAVAEACDREANRMYGNVRWLNLIAVVAPLFGLLGTVWGMIRAFFDTTQLAATENKADFLASGIYVALVTTLGGLAIAIPAAISAHYFEGRIQNIFHRIEELLFNLLPLVERYEGQTRLHPAKLRESDGAARKTTEHQPTAPR